MIMERALSIILILVASFLVFIMIQSFIRFLKKHEVIDHGSLISRGSTEIGYVFVIVSAFMLSSVTNFYISGAFQDKHARELETYFDKSFLSEEIVSIESEFSVSSRFVIIGTITTKNINNEEKVVSCIVTKTFFDPSIVSCHDITNSKFI